MLYSLALALLLTAVAPSPADTKESASESETTETREKAFIVLSTHKTYAAALSNATAAGAILEIHYDSRGLAPDKATGLTFSRRECAENFWNYPCYVPRGANDDGIWLSIEYSSSYNGFPAGLYLLVAASAPPDDPLIAATLHRIGDTYPETRVLRAPIYVGCIH